MTHAGSTPAEAGRSARLAKERPAPEGILPGLPPVLVATVEGSPPKADAASSPVAPSQKAVAQIAAEAGPSGGQQAPVSLTAAIWDDDDASLHGLFLPFEAGVGAAAFVRGDDMLVVFDVPRPLDLSSVLANPLAAGASVQLLETATVLRLPGQGARGLAMRRFPTGWLIEHADPGKTGDAIAPIMANDTMRLPVREPGRTIVVPDPRTGGNLLVGTVRGGQQAVRAGRRGVAEIIEPTIEGVVIDPLSDRLELRPVKDAFILSGTGAGVLNVADLGSGVGARVAAGAARVMTLRDRPLEMLARQFADAKAEAAAAPAEERFVPRIRAAEAALALGDGPQAETIAQVAMADDSRGATALRPRLVLAAARLLDHRPLTDDPLGDPRAMADGDAALWRAVRLAERDHASAEAARLFAAGFGLLKTYPAPLRAALLPIAEEALVRGGTDAQAAMIENAGPAQKLAFPAALLAMRRGSRQSALATLDQLASDRDAVLADQAIEEAVTIREAMPKADPGRLAAFLEPHLLDARIGGHELASRLHLADLWDKAGQWRKALDQLREAASLFPDHQKELRLRAGAVLKHLAETMAKSDAGAALDQVAMIEGNADMLPDGADGREISLFLADRLSELDLPERAAPVVRKMMLAAAPGSDRAELGLRLASLELQQNDLAGVQTAISGSDAAGLPADLVGRRALVSARASAGAGQPGQALAWLASVDSPAALDFKAGLLARQGDWKGAADILLGLTEKDEASGSAADAPSQDLLLRLASAASRSGDNARLARARDLGRGRLADPGKAALFDLLTADQGVPMTDAARPSPDMTALRHAPAILDAISD